jgi:hypothetical protein
MDELRAVTVSMNDRFFTIDLPIEDERLIASVFLGLGQYVKKGFPIKVRQSYLTFSGSEEIVTKIISKTQQMAEWAEETRGLISAIRKRT